MCNIIVRFITSSDYFANIFALLHGINITYYWPINIQYNVIIIIAYINIGGEGWLGFPDLGSGQETWWNWYLIPVVNFGEVRRAQLAKSTLISALLPLESFQMLKREWGAESTGKLPNLFIPSKTSIFVPIFQRKICLWAEPLTWCLSMPSDRTFWWRW